MTLARRLKAVEAARPRCAGGPTRLVDAGAPPEPDDRCPGCGGRHVLEVEEVVVGPAADPANVDDRRTPGAMP